MPIPAASPAQGEPVSAAVAAAAKAAPSILPSSPMSMMPERSENKPARAARIRGADRRSVESSTSTSRVRNSISAPAPTQQRRPQCGNEHELERAREQDHEALDHHHHVAGDAGNLERQLGAPLIESAEEE